jgi:predicted alpha-1,2-mannosidase
VLVKVGVSFVSVANAERNLDAESPGWDFDAVRDATLAAWEARLGRVRVDGGSDDERTVFYTALYHAHIHPSLFSDANGEYLGFDSAVHSKARPHYHNLSSWDEYRSQIPLVALLAPVEAGDLAQSLVDDAAEDPGGGLPRWVHANRNSGGMLGDSPTPVLATLQAFGVQFDGDAALAAMERGASQPGTTSGGYEVRERLSEYLANGYVANAIDASVARTLEYATDDFALSRFAAARGDGARRDRYLARSHAWRNHLHGGSLVPRASDGAFADFDPTSQHGFKEGDGAQYLWMVPFDLRGLIDALGGNAAVIARLDDHFTRLNDGPGSRYAFLGNEPELIAPWVYAFAGAPERSAAVVRRALDELYRASPSGVPGNDDGGAMGSWVVWGSIGLYPAIPGVAGFVVGSPRFPSLRIETAGGEIAIDAAAASAQSLFVQRLLVDGQAHDSPWLPWSLLRGGARLELTLGSTPNGWGKGPANAPPSFE